ncbi:DUF6979 family protein [Edwardsiella anguillarum]|uniref:DUF6979 family protein n=1 Tax=Edwardsiella anguillarum TaxID=1821960 RepID=UPI0024B8429A|nr:hypothetical protein [Edwardsiella anguillarum]WHQ15872.1 hypothetical protein MQ083_08995 [Edwardsiella anguillarum]
MKAPSECVYGKIAGEAYRLARDGMPPAQAWDKAVVGKDKGCPRAAFLGLCEAGYLKDIPTGSYQKSGSKNARYATVAANYLLAHRIIANDVTPSALWKVALTNEVNPPETYNSQMHIVLTLWEAGVIQSPPR